MLTTDQEFFTVSEVAKLIKIAPWRLHRLIKIGDLRAVDISVNRSVKPRWRISRIDLERFLAVRSTSPEPTPVRQRKATESEVIEFYMRANKKRPVGGITFRPAKAVLKQLV